MRSTRTRSRADRSGEGDPLETGQTGQTELVTQLVDATGLEQAATFVWRRLRRHDLELLEWFKLLPLHGHHLLRGLCRYPVRAAPQSRVLAQGYRITASANVRPAIYPHRYSLAIGSVTHEVGESNGRRARRRRREWSYVLEEVTFRDPAETLVFVAGHEAFHFLRHARQIEGRNTEPGANRYGLEWLREWREEQGRARATMPTRRAARAAASAAQLLLPLA